MKAYLYLGAAALAASAGPALAVPKGFKAEADRILAAAYKADAPGAAVIVTEGGRTVYAGARGLADLEAKTPITPDTVFRIGSITKQFSAAVMMQLVAEGKVSLDDPLSKFIPDYPQPGASATVGQLLNHTSGVMSYTAIPGWMVEANTGKAHSTDELVGVFKALPSPARPGEAWAYNNSGYVLVGAIIEKVTGKPWHQAVAERIAAPLGLSALSYDEAAAKRMAKGYHRSDKGYVPAPKIHMSVPHAAGGLVGTVGDLATWAHAFHHGKVVPAGGYAAMTTPARLSDGKTHPYGFGLQLEQLRGMKAVGHGGGIFGFQTASTYLPDKDLFVAVFANAIPAETSPDALASRLAALAAGDPFPAFEKQAADVKALEPWLGVYRIAGGGQRIFYAQDGKLFTRRDGAPMEVFAAGGNRFFYGDGLTWFELAETSGERVMKMHQPSAKAVEIAARLGPVPAEAKPVDVPRAILERYVGSYAVMGQKAVITLGADGLSVKLGEQPTFRLVPRGMNEFEVGEVGARVTFNGADSGGRAASMTISQNGQKFDAPRAD